MYVLAIDCGTQSLKAVVFDKTGKTIAVQRVGFEPYYANMPGYAEQDPKIYYKSLCKATRNLIEAHPILFDAIGAVTVTTQRDMAICVDKQGVALRSAIIWADQRMIKVPRKMALHHRLAFSVIGMKPTTEILSRSCKAHWIQDHEPKIWEKTYKYLQLSGYLNHKLTGLFLDSVASQIGHIPFSYKHFRWEKKKSLKHDIFHIEDDKLCTLVQSSETIGRLTDKAAEETGLRPNLIVIAAGSDKGCETLGVGCMDNESISISLGSQASVQTTTSKYYEALTFIPPFQAVIPGYYNPEVQIYRGYWMISWFKKEFAAKEVKLAEKLGISPEALLEKALVKIPPGSDGLILQPYWGAGVKMHDAKGAILGFSDDHTRLHIYRAIIEGIGFALFEGMQRIEKKSRIKVRKIMVSGGGSQSDAICQITANIFNLPVNRVQTYETSALGAAIAGFVGLKVYADYEEAILHMVHNQDAFLPQKDQVDLYERIYHRIYKKIYKRVKPIYKSFDQL
ncbi:FGGY-family carbohydrate kinase [Petrocella sp. FN5]|uniref:FGGY-family carbohydrate kinase n=1 Tax=Petrocella sp. FN5 TaxID=3032002 RepID=UPI0023DB345F|nr:FGGY-family carbohydrate kinase [Petrocella sp. FN5]MDF1616446.1 FGGY-family carbohydrate kinase [Petrocella sp. FN5]